MALAYNNTNRTYIVSTWYVVFYIAKNATKFILPEYLFMYFNRSEFDRYARINSWGSAREYFWLGDMENIELDLPSISIQQKYVDVYNAKVGDKVLFNESRRFGNVLYNNLKGSILSIDKKTDEIVFQILVDKIISERDVLFSDIKLIDCDCEGKSIVEFSVKRRVERDSDSDYSEQIVPFQIAYAVSIHKAQGLEYKSVKVVITEDIDEKISHNIFYTAITRTTDKLKIYMSKETQKKLAEKFVKSNVGLKQAQLFAGQAGLKLKNKLSS